MKNKIKLNNSYESSEYLSTSLSSEDVSTEDKSFNQNQDQRIDLPTLLTFNNLPSTSLLPSSLNSSINDQTEKSFEIFQKFPINIPNNKFEIGLKSIEDKNYKIIKNDTTSTTLIIGDLITENSCNAVDNKLSNDLIELNNDNKTETNNLTFNGRIDRIPEENIVYKIDYNSKLLAHDTSCMMYTNEKSPDLFEDDESNNDLIIDESYDAGDIESLCTSITQQKNNESVSEHENLLVKDEEILLKRLQMSLTGVLPPPSLTISQLNITKMIDLYKDNDKFLATIREEGEKNCDSLGNEISSIPEQKAKPRRLSLLAPTHSVAEISTMAWPEVKTVKSHGIYYNRSKYSEKFESLCLKYVERYIGAETSSSFSILMSPTSAKKRNMRMKLLGKSPGNRLSHLARRRAIFSSENLAGHSSKPSTSTSSLNLFNDHTSKRQILLDPKKITRNTRKTITPKRRTPGRRTTPSHRKTPTSKHKKSNKNVLGDLTLSRETSKRALFQSPAKSIKPISNIPQITPEIANRAQKSKRQLFTPEKNLTRCQSFTFNENERNIENSIGQKGLRLRFNSMNCLNELNDSCSQNSSLNLISQKRKRECDIHESEKFIENNIKLTPNSLKFVKSQSFCVNTENQDTLNLSNNRHLLYRSTSEIIPSGSSQAQLSDHHRKKLFWAVSHALQLKQINVKNPNFKQFASVLARVTKKLYLEYEQNQPGSTSEKMMKLTNRLVFYVIQGKTVDEIYDVESENLENLKKKLEKQNSFLQNDKNLSLKLE